MIIKNHFHKKGFALGLVLKQRLAASWKWPIFLHWENFLLRDPVVHIFINNSIEKCFVFSKFDVLMKLFEFLVTITLVLSGRTEQFFKMAKDSAIPTLAESLVEEQELI